MRYGLCQYTYFTLQAYTMPIPWYIRSDFEKKSEWERNTLKIQTQINTVYCSFCGENIHKIFL